MNAHRLNKGVMLAGILAILMIMLILVLSTGSEADYSGEFIEGDEKTANPGDSVTMSMSVGNNGDEDTEFRLDDPELPQDWEFHWEGGSNKTIQADSSSDFTILINVSEDNDKARAGEYHFEITGEYDTDTGSEAISGSCYLDLNVNAVYDVRLFADDTSDSAKPGETVSYKAEIRNTGNINETYQLLLLDPSSQEDASDWATIVGAGPGGHITVIAGGAKFIDLVVDIPDFTAENDDAEHDLFGIRLKAKSQNDTDVDSEVTFQLDVEEFYNMSQWPDNPGRNGMLKGNEDTVLSFTLNVRNLGNTDDTIRVFLPGGELTGEMADWEVTFEGQDTAMLSLGSLEKKMITVDVTVDRDTRLGEYILVIRGESQRDSSVSVETMLYINLTKAHYGLELTKMVSAVRKVNPADGSEIEFKFTLANTGNAEDGFTVEVKTPTQSGTYKDWIIKFENKGGERVDSISIPNDLPGQTGEYLLDGEWVEFSLFVIVDMFEDEGVYEDIAISAQSDCDSIQIEYIYSNLTVILPNIRLSDDPWDFYADPDSGIEVGDTIEITLRVYNDGSAETGEFYVWFYNGELASPLEEEGDYLAIHRIDNIPAQAYYDVTVTWDDVPAGANDIFVYADKPIRSGNRTSMINDVFSPYGSILEERENDNFVTIHDGFKEEIDLRPDLTILGVECDDKKARGTTTVTVIIANVGSANAAELTAKVNVRIGGVSLKDKKTDSESYLIEQEIVVDDDIDVEFLWNVPDEVKNYTVKVTVDHDDDPNSANDRFATYVQSLHNATYPSTTDPGGSDSSTDYTFITSIFIIILLVAILFVELQKVRFVREKDKLTGDEGSGIIAPLTVPPVQPTPQRPPHDPTQVHQQQFQQLAQTQPMRQAPPQQIGQQPPQQPPYPPGQIPDSTPLPPGIPIQSKGSWTCPRCGKSIDESYKLCMYCGSERTN